MIGILVATHGKFAEEILKSAELIVGKQDQTLALGLHHGDSIEEFGEKVKEGIQSLEKGNGVLVFVDLFGASPYNAAALSSNKLVNSKFRCVTGVSLPMILEALTMRGVYELDQLTDHCMEVGTKGIKELFKEMDKLIKSN